MWVVSFYVYIDAVQAAGDCIFVSEISSDYRAELVLTNGMVLKLTNGALNMGITGATGTIVLSTNAWHHVCWAVDLAASGVIKTWVDGVLDINTTHSSSGTGTPTDHITFGSSLGNALTGNAYVDDMRIDVGGVAVIAAHKVVARQGQSGTPTYNSWTKHGASASNAYQDWSDTPFDTTNYCDDTSLSAFQTMLTASFSSTQSGHGTDVIVSGDTINGAKVGLVGKTSVTAGGANAANIRRRLASVDTDTAITFTTADAYYETGIFTDTLTNLNASQIGGGHGGVAATHTIRDVWMMVDYTPAATTLTAAFSMAGAGALSGVGVTFMKTAASIAGAASTNLIGAAFIQAALAAAGVGAASWTGAAFIAALLAATGTGAAALAGAAFIRAALTSAGVASTGLAGSAVIAAVLSVAGVAVTALAGTTILSAALAAAGMAVGAFLGASLITSALGAAGSAASTLKGAAFSASALTSAGVASLSATGAAFITAALGAAGVATSSLVGAAKATAAMVAAGAGSALWRGSAIIKTILSAIGGAIVRWFAPVQTPAERIVHVEAEDRIVTADSDDRIAYDGRLDADEQ